MIINTIPAIILALAVLPFITTLRELRLRAIFNNPPKLFDIYIITYLFVNGVELFRFLNFKNRCYAIKCHESYFQFLKYSDK